MIKNEIINVEIIQPGARSRSDGRPTVALLEEKRAYQRLRRPRERKRDD